MRRVDSRVLRRLHMMERMRKGGLSAVDADTAARVALTSEVHDRDRRVLAARAIGLTMRQIGMLFGLSHVQVIRLVRQGAADVPSDEGKVKPSK